MIPLIFFSVRLSNSIGTRGFVVPRESCTPVVRVVVALSRVEKVFPVDVAMISGIVLYMTPSFPVGCRNARIDIFPDPAARIYHESSYISPYVTPRSVSLRRYWEETIPFCGVNMSEFPLKLPGIVCIFDGWDPVLTYVDHQESSGSNSLLRRRFAPRVPVEVYVLYPNDWNTLAVVSNCDMI